MSTAWMRTPGRSSSSSPPCFPYGAKLLINGHHYAQAQAAKAGIAFTALDNGFAACDDPAAVQAICDALTEDTIEALARKWPAVLPNPYSAADQAAGYRYDISVLQAEFSLTQVLDQPLSGRIFSGQATADNLAIGRPDQVGLIFGRRIVRKGPRSTPGRFRTRVITSGVTPSLHAGYKNLEDQAIPQARAKLSERKPPSTTRGTSGSASGCPTCPRCGRRA